MEVVNQVVNGWHSDNHPTAQPPGTYRNSKNGIILDLGGGNFQWQSLKGNTSSFTLPAHASGQGLFSVIGWVAFVDKLIILSANTNNTTGSMPGEIGIVTLDTLGAGTYTPIYYHTGLRFTKAHAIAHDQIVAKRENSLIQRIYWTDFFNPMRSINTSNSKFTTYFTTGNLVVGNQYMVLSTGAGGTITHNAVVYGPGETAGNIFTAVNANFTTSGSPLVIEYVPIDILDVVPKYNLGNINFSKWLSSGALIAGQYQFFYQLESSDGALTNYSYLSRPIPLPSNIVPTDQTISYATVQGEDNTTNTVKGLRINIDGIDTNYSKIRVGFIRSTGYNTYDLGKVFYYGSISGSSMDFDCLGGTVIANVTIDELTTPVVSMDIVKTITSMKNRLFAANIGGSSDPDFDPTGTDIKVIEYMVPADIQYAINATTSIAAGWALYGTGQVQSSTVSNGFAYIDQWYYVVSGSCDYNGTTFGIGEVAGPVFRGTSGAAAAGAITGTGVAVAIILIQKHGGTGGVGEYEFHRIENDFVDNKGSTTPYYLRSYWRGEKYRFGVMLYDNKGTPLYVQWMNDVTFPNQYDTGYTNPDGSLLGFSPRLSQIYTNAGDDNANYSYPCSTRNLGIELNDLNFNEIATNLGVSIADLGTKISGFSIVRAIRDPQIVAQGILYPTMIDGSDTRPCVTQQVDGSNNYAAVVGNNRRINNYLWYSPDYQCHFNGLPTLLSGDKLRIEDYYITNSTKTPLADGNQIVSDEFWKGLKMLTPTAPVAINPGSENVLDVSNCAELLAGQSVTLPGINFIGDGLTVSGAPYGANLKGYNGQSMLFRTQSNEGAGGVYDTILGGYGEFLASAQKKPLVNLIRPKSVFYGGTTDIAKAATTYIYCGHYQAIDAAFVSHLNDTTGGKATGYARNIQVFGGDCFVNLYDTARVLPSFASGSSADTDIAQAIIFPVESNVNTHFIRKETVGGYVRNRVNAVRFSGPTGIGIHYPLRPESFKYDGMYSNDENEILYPARPIDLTQVVREEHIVRYSEQKFDGELIDNFKRFLTNNYEKVDGQYGEIVNLRNKSGRLFYWQNKGVGYIPVQERTTLDGALGGAVQLGVGGIAERFDEVDTYFGNQHQMGLMETPDAFLWFDLRRKSLVRMSTGGDAIALSLMQGIHGELFNRLEEIRNFNGSTAQSTPNIFTDDSPLLGRGITSIYDTRFEIGLMTFKMTGVKSIGGSPRLIDKDFTIIFDKTLQKFIGITSLVSGHYINYNGWLLSIHEPRNVIVGSFTYAEGDEIVDASGNYYACILPFTSSATPTQPALDSTHWEIMSNTKNTIWFNWFGTICKFNGAVKESYLEFAIQPDMDLSKFFDNFELYGNEIQITDVTCSTEDQTSSDTDIKSTNYNYEYFRKKWFSNVPLQNSRTNMEGNYLIARFRMKNWLSSIRTSLNQVKKIVYLKTIYRHSK